MHRFQNLIVLMLPPVLCGLLLCGCLPEQDRIVRGHLSGDLIWQGDVYLSGDVVLAEDAFLKILPGTRVFFMTPEPGDDGATEHPYFAGSELIVKGQVHAIGTASQPILFAAADPAASAGSWGAVNIEGSREAVFEFCIFRQADSAIHSRDAQVYIEQSIFDNNLVGVRFHDSEILIEHNLFHRNQAGIRFHFGSPVICENEFRNNRVHLFVTSHPRDYLIENNTFGAASDYQVVLGELVPEDLRMPRNFWALPSADSLPELFYDGRRSDYLGKVVFEPRRTTPSRQAGLSWTP